MNKAKVYSKTFYASMNEKHQCSNLTSSMEIVPYVLELFPDTKSVIDFGCGSGTFLRTFKDNGIKKVTGLDGEWVDRDSLLISDNEFIPTNLTNAKDLKFDEKYDIAMSVEVAEHIDEQYANDFVDAMIRASDVIIFGAAIPGQGGAEHVNEQWQSYWVEMFEERGYACYDLIRPRFSRNKMVQHWYAQNTFVYISKNLARDFMNSNDFVNSKTFCMNYALPDTCAHLKHCNTGWTYTELFGRLSETIKVVVKKAIRKK